MNKSHAIAPQQEHPREALVNAPDPNFAETKAMLTEMLVEMEESRRAAGGSISEVAAGWVTPHYWRAMRDQLAALSEGPERFKLLRMAVGDVVVLQRGSHSAAWLQLGRERLELEQQKHRDALAAAQKEIQELRDPKLPLSDADRQAIVDKADEILGLK
jgi:plasmid stabilization system protein ParE